MSDEDAPVDRTIAQELEMPLEDQVRQLIHTGRCPNCGATTLDEDWYAAIPDGAVVQWDCPDCEYQNGTTQDEYKRLEAIGFTGGDDDE